MNFGICSSSSIPIRKEPSTRSELVSEILFGEHFVVKEMFMGWAYIKQQFDGVEGWIDCINISEISSKIFDKLNSKNYAVSTDSFNIVSINDNAVRITAGSSLPFWRKIKKEFSLFGTDFYQLHGRYNFNGIKNIYDSIVQGALTFSNSPYLEGGRTPLGIDSSGLIQLSLKMAKIYIPRNLNEQVLEGTQISFVEESKNGDLAFFQNENGEIINVGIIWEKNKIIHVSDKVCVENIDQYGIYNKNGRYTHNLRVIKRVLP